MPAAIKPADKRLRPTPPNPQRSEPPRRSCRNERLRPALARMDKLFLAVVVSGLLVLVTAAGLYALSKGTVTPHPPTHAIRQQRH